MGTAEGCLAGTPAGRTPRPTAGDNPAGAARRPACPTRQRGRRCRRLPLRRHAGHTDAFDGRRAREPMAARPRSAEPPLWPSSGNSLLRRSGAPTPSGRPDGSHPRPIGRSTTSRRQAPRFRRWLRRGSKAGLTSVLPVMLGPGPHGHEARLAGSFRGAHDGGPGQLVDCGGNGGDGLQHEPREGQDGGTRLGEPDRVPRAVEQRLPQFLLQPTHQRAHPGLGDVQPGGRAGEALLVRQEAAAGPTRGMDRIRPDWRSAK